jgi:glucose/arabinose dehydrogenase
MTSFTRTSRGPGPARRGARPALAAVLLILGVLALIASLAPPVRTARVQTVVPAGFSETLVTAGLQSPTAMAIAPDGRIFVCEQGGSVRVVKNGTLLSTPFVQVSVDPLGERGLLGVTFDPQFATNRYVYVYYTLPTTPRRNRISRFVANGDVAAPGEDVVMDLDPLGSSTNHNGGALHFGPDGYLYVAVGENAVSTNAQSLSNRLGKILRIEGDGGIPTGNPFPGAVGVNRAIWAMGLRNPFTFAFDPGSGRMFINDVGATAWEEINEGIAGANYGWPTTEGPTSDTRYRSPLLAYPHGTGTDRGCAITGGVFYNPQTVQFPAEYVGKYFYADFCNDWIRVYDPLADTSSLFATGLSFPVDLDVAADGSLYVLTRGQGILRYQYLEDQGPEIVVQPADRTVGPGQAAQFTVSASGSPPLAYRWQRAGTDIPGATGSAYTLPSASPADSGARFRVIVSNARGSVTSREAVLTVSANGAPAGRIETPVAGTRYRA